MYSAYYGTFVVDERGISMKLKRTVILAILLITALSIPAMAKPVKNGPIFMGEILEVNKDNENNTLRLLVRGYIKGCEVYEEELICIVNENTEIIENKCFTTEGEAKEKLTYKNIEVSKGDRVFIVLSDAMTKSIPPQTAARAIQVSKAPQ